jgi:predicted phosphodiesterase
VTTRWAVFSDIHGNLPALEAVLADAVAVDGWLNLGDILSGPLWPRETADWLMRRDWPTIVGNHERQLLTLARGRMGPSDAYAAAAITDAQRAWLAALPAAMTPAPGLRCVHGSPRSDVEYLMETVTPEGVVRAATAAELHERTAGVDADAALLLCGHTHVPRLAMRGALQVANPGSVGLPAYDDDHPVPHVVENGTPQARYAIVEHDGAAGWRVTLRAVDYDFEPAARRAAANGRPDWADALRTGRVGRRERDVFSASSRAPSG